MDPGVPCLYAVLANVLAGLGEFDLIEVLAFLRQIRQEDVSLRPAALASRIQDRYGITVHPRSIERALVRSQKKTP